MGGEAPRPARRAAAPPNVNRNGTAPQATIGREADDPAAAATGFVGGHEVFPQQHKHKSEGRHGRVAARPPRKPSGGPPPFIGSRVAHRPKPLVPQDLGYEAGAGGVRGQHAAGRPAHAGRDERGPPSSVGIGAPVQAQAPRGLLHRGASRFGHGGEHQGRTSLPGAGVVDATPQEREAGDHQFLFIFPCVFC